MVETKRLPRNLLRNLLHTPPSLSVPYLAAAVCPGLREKMIYRQCRLFKVENEPVQYEIALQSRATENGVSRRPLEISS